MRSNALGPDQLSDTSPRVCAAPASDGQRAVTLWFEPADGVFEVRIEQPFVFVPAGGAEVLLDLENDPVGLGPVFACTRTSVDEAMAFDDGSLRLSFVDGSSVQVPGSPQYEAWGMVGPAGLRVVSVPGGELAIWQPDEDD